ncbi:MarR family winged helix-turn-helix transcriptional regulator [Paractinoplanes atraurantiacus]|uniref:DNA-binding transcriptional regulator, MarR family n=1 Tax=Paractinoplanes atraurantiacus TaxID=1036182 RepID=A0A285ICI3_9ACTN|nr:MarR family winged helix-turn-helix transcriptional regulator [Actinoplanes atraurantiacus]SNY45685.1 DNA-binding transcriptional regulator, MarR family [Actinoplanes atraurantiacus]
MHEEESLSEAFWAVARRLRNRTKVALEPWDLSPSQGRAMNVLAHHGDLRLSSLAEHLRIAPRSATEVVDDLQQRGLVERRPDPVDRRAVLVTLTPHGTTVNTEIQAARQAASARLFAALDPADRQDLARVLEKLRDEG